MSQFYIQTNLVINQLLANTNDNRIWTKNNTFPSPSILFVWFDFYVSVSNFSGMLGWVFLGWTSTKQGSMCLAQGHNATTPVRLKLSTDWSRVKHSTTEPLHSHKTICTLSNKITLLHKEPCLWNFLIATLLHISSKQKMLPMGPKKYRKCHNLKRQICCWCFCWSFFMCVFVLIDFHRLKFTLTDSGLHISCPSGPVIPWAINSLDFWKYKMDIHAWMNRAHV